MTKIPARLFVIAVSVLAGTVAYAASAAPDQLPQTFTNLKVLPANTAQPELIGVMRQFAITLGVRCEHCHVGEGNDLSQFDFASDAKPTKAIARRMLQMVNAINGEHLEGVGAPSDTPKVTCFTCHRGQTTPLTAPEGGGGQR